MSYCIVTPAKNEQEYLPHVIDSVETQTVEPCLWVIVDDGSTDSTPSVIQEACHKYPYVESIRLPEAPRSSWGVRYAEVCIAGFEYATSKGKYDHIGLLDADILPDKDYFEKLIVKLFFKDFYNHYFKYIDGDWSGNDTIWRTVIDLVRIITYSDFNGKLHNVKQRKFFSVIDGIIGGDKNGPLVPSPKNAKTIIMGEDLYLTDLVSSFLMGLNYKKIPLMRNSLKLKDFPIVNEEDVIKILKLYNTKILVIDADPETRSSKKIAMSVKYGFRVRYRDVLKSSIDLNERLITAEKTEALDAVKTALLTQKIIYPIMLNGEYVKQMIASTRVFNPKKSIFNIPKDSTGFIENCVTIMSASFAIQIGT